MSSFSQRFCGEKSLVTNPFDTQGWVLSVLIQRWHLFSVQLVLPTWRLFKIWVCQRCSNDERGQLELHNWMALGMAVCLFLCITLFTTSTWVHLSWNQIYFSLTDLVTIMDFDIVPTFLQRLLPGGLIARVVHTWHLAFYTELLLHSRTTAVRFLCLLAVNSEEDWTKQRLHQGSNAIITRARATNSCQ